MPVTTQLIYNLKNLRKISLIKKLNRVEHKLSKEAKVLAITLKQLGSVLGLLESVPQHFLQGKEGKTENDVDTDYIDDLIQQRNIARDKKDFARADEIRKQLTELDIGLEDTEDGTDWRRN